MSKNTKIKWRLSALPDADEVTRLVSAGILTKEEAREILFSLETEEDRTKKSLQEEIKFLRDLVAKITSNRSVIIENIKYVQRPYSNQDWFQPYQAYYTTTAGNTAGAQLGVSGGVAQATYSLGSSTNTISLAAQTSALQGSGFTDIKTF